jgi:Family of unknown function (DUF6461)
MGLRAAPAGVARTLAPVTATPEYYAELLEAFPDPESLTVLVVARASTAEVAAELSIDLRRVVDSDEAAGDEESTAWALLDVPGGVLAVEPTGFGDPTLATLARLSSGGRAAAVVRTNVLAHQRFGAARDGEVTFDDNEYMYVDDPGVVPTELRALFDLVWDDLSEDSDEDDEGPDGVPVGLAMAEVVTGLEVTTAQVEALLDSPFHPAPRQTYAEDLDD